MPVSPAVASSAISAGSGLIGGLLNFFTSKKNRKEQAIQNQKDREFQEYMYSLQRKDALADNFSTNQYNSPEQQMNRLRQAGLNPNLIYGKGAENTSAAIRSSTANAPNQPAPQTDNKWMADTFNQLGNAGNQLMQNRSIQAQTDNTRASTQLMGTETNLKNANISKLMTEQARTTFDLEQAKQLKDVVIMKANADLASTKASTTFTISANQRANMQNATNIAKTMQDIIESKIRVSKTEIEKEQLKVMMENTKKETELKELDRQLKENGIQPGDPVYLRIMQKFLQTGIMSLD